MEQRQLGVVRYFLQDHLVGVDIVNNGRGIIGQHGISNFFLEGTASIAGNNCNPTPLETMNHTFVHEYMRSLSYMLLGLDGGFLMLKQASRGQLSTAAPRTPLSGNGFPKEAETE